MERFSFSHLDGFPHIKIEQSLGLSEEEESTFNSIWEKESKTKDIFDGKVLYFLNSEEEALSCFWGPYRYWYSQFRMKEESKNKLSVLAVTGVVIQGDKVLLGKRTKNVAQNALMWDLVPSGGISFENGTNWQTQIYEELYEELGVDEKSTKHLKILGLLHDARDCVVDIVVIIEINDDLASLGPKNHELSELREADLNQGDLGELSPSSSYVINILKRKLSNESSP